MGTCLGFNYRFKGALIGLCAISMLHPFTPDLLYITSSYYKKDVFHPFFWGEERPAKVHWKMGMYKVLIDLWSWALAWSLACVSSWKLGLGDKCLLKLSEKHQEYGTPWVLNLSLTSVFQNTTKYSLLRSKAREDAKQQGLPQVLRRIIVKRVETWRNRTWMQEKFKDSYVATLVYAAWTTLLSLIFNLIHIHLSDDFYLAEHLPYK